MALQSDRQLCNGIPVDHRLKRFLLSIKQKHTREIGNHVKIIEAFGNTMVCDDKTTPTWHETAFAKWLAKPEMTGGVVIALQQPTKSQVFTADLHWVRDECASLAYQNECLEFVGITDGMDTTSIFDVFLFIIENISTQELTNESKTAYNTFMSMVEAKKPKVLFTCGGFTVMMNSLFPGKNRVGLRTYID